LNFRNLAVSINDFRFIHTQLESLIKGNDDRVAGNAAFSLANLLLNESYPFQTSGTNSSYLFSLLLRAASHGQPQAQFQLGAAYSTGVHLTTVPTDPASAVLLTYMAALSGSHEANIAMG
jgi:TPR repeat protein